MHSFAIFFAQGFFHLLLWGHVVVYPSLHLQHTCTQPFKEPHFLPLFLICGPILSCMEADSRFVWNIYIFTEFVGARLFWAEDHQLGGPFLQLAQSMLLYIHVDPPPPCIQAL